MRQPLSVVLLSVCLLAVLAAGCDSSPMPTPTAVVIQPIATTSATVITATPSIPIATNVITLTPFVLHLPAAAPVLYPTAAEWGNWIRALQQAQPHLATYLTALAAASAPDERVAFAHLALAEQDLTLIAVVVPSDGLTLQTYLTAAQAELVQSRLALGSGIVVESATIRYDLHEAHIPLATIQYTLPVNGPVNGPLNGPADGNDSARVTASYQAAMLDQTGTHLLLLTFVSEPGQPAAQEQIETILARLQDTTIDP